MIYLDNAASSFPKPEIVYGKTFDFIRHNGANAGRSGHFYGMQVSEMVYDTRKKLAHFFGVEDASCAVFALNATHALNTVIFGVISPGDHVITTNLEHNSVLRPLYALQDSGVQLDIIDADLYEDEKTVQRIADKICEKTRAIVVTQCSNVCGKMLPIEAIARLKNEHISLIVDGSQGAGSIPTDLRSLGVDYYCAPFHKGMLALAGGGFAICLGKAPRPLLFGGTGSESANRGQPDRLPERLEVGTLPIPAICSLNASLDFLNSRGIETVFEEKKALSRYTAAALDGIKNVRLSTDYRIMPSPGVISFYVEGAPSEQVAEYLSEQGFALRAGLHCAPLFHQKMGSEQFGTLRISLGYANTVMQIDALVRSLKYF